MNKHQQEFIGEKVEITESKNKEQLNIKGTIIDETKNTFTIKTQTKTIKILKKDKNFTINNEKIEGNKITKEPEERIKSKSK